MKLGFVDLVATLHHTLKISVSGSKLIQVRRNIALPQALGHTWHWAHPPFLFLWALLGQLPLSGFWSYRNPNKGLSGDSARLQEVLFIHSFTSPGPSPKCRNLMTTSDTIVATEHLRGPLTGIHSVKNM